MGLVGLVGLGKLARAALVGDLLKRVGGDHAVGLKLRDLGDLG